MINGPTGDQTCVRGHICGTLGQIVEGLAQSIYHKYSVLYVHAVAKVIFCARFRDLMIFWSDFLCPISLLNRLGLVEMWRADKEEKGRRRSNRFGVRHAFYFCLLAS